MRKEGILQMVVIKGGVILAEHWHPRLDNMVGSIRFWSLTIYRKVTCIPVKCL